MMFKKCVALFLTVLPFILNGQDKQKPNIIFILCDDLGVGDIAIFRGDKLTQDKSIPQILSPYIDKLAGSGAMLTQHYVNAPVCAPSRASLVSGVHQGIVNVRDNQFDKAIEQNYNISNTLRSIGYQTAIIGKWGLQGTTADWPAHPLKRGFDYFFGYMRHSDGHEHYPKEGLYRGAKQVWENTNEISQTLDKCYTTDLWTAAAKRWITAQHSGEQPFFLFLSFDCPHAVLELPTQRYPEGGGLTGGIQWTGTPGNMINTASGEIDSWTDPSYRSATFDHDQNPNTAEKPWPETQKRYATSVSRIDRSIGDIEKLLKDLKIEDNTIIVFSSDNGPSMESYLPKDYAANSPSFFKGYGPFDGVKRDCWEGGIRVPTIIKWPKQIKPGIKVNTPSIFSDWAATFLDASGVAAPSRFSGVSLLPSLTQKGNQLPSRIYIEYTVAGNTPNLADFEKDRQGRKRGQMQAIRFGDFMGVRYNVTDAESPFEIYNVVKDPKQLQDLSGRPEMQKLSNTLMEASVRYRLVDADAKRPYDNAFVPAIERQSLSKGLKWRTFDKSTDWIPQTYTLRPKGSGTAADFRKLPLFKGLVSVSGYLNIPEDGTYTFEVSAAQKAVLKLHDTPVIDADFGYKGGQKKYAVKLKKGYHQFELSYQGTGKSQDVLFNCYAIGSSGSLSVTEYFHE